MPKVVRRRPCHYCNGTRKETRFVGCSECNGNGMVPTNKAKFIGAMKMILTFGEFDSNSYKSFCEQRVCPACKGEKKILITRVCTSCKKYGDPQYLEEE